MIFSLCIYVLEQTDFTSFFTNQYSPPLFIKLISINMLLVMNLFPFPIKIKRLILLNRK